MMKLRVLPLILAAGFSSMAFADCDIKASVLEAKIAAAEKYGNTAKVAGLQKALTQLKANCTDDAKLQRAQEKVAKYEAKVTKAQAEVTEAQANLSAAQAASNSKKIVKYQKKLLEKQASLKEASAALAKAKAELAALQG